MGIGIKKVFLGLLLASIGTGLSAPMLRIFPDSPYSFGPTTIDTSKTVEFSLTNIGTGILRVCNVSVSMGSPNFEIVSDRCSGSSLAYGASCNISVRYTPNLKVNNVGAISVAYDDDEDNVACNTVKSASISLSGSGTAIRVVKVSPAPSMGGFSFSFPATDFGNTSTMTFRICNAAGDPLVLNNPALELLNTPDSTTFGIVSSNCQGAVLNYAANNSDCSQNYCEFNVVFQPQSGYPYSKTTFYGYVRINDLNGGPDGQPSGSTISLLGEVNPPTGVIFADIGQSADQLVQLNFTCPDDPTTNANATQSTFDLTYSLSGSSYFSLPNGVQACPTQCTENKPVYCNILVRFSPETPGTFTGRLIIGYPGGSLVRTIYGVAGSSTGNYLDVDPDVINFGTVFRFASYGASLIIKNTTGSALEFQPQAVGAGVSISGITCGCNTGYASNGQFCTPSGTPTTSRAYRIRPGEICSISVAFSPPIVGNITTINAAILLDTPAQVIAIPVIATMEAPSPPTNPSTGLPSFGSGGGCSSTGLSLLGLLAFLPAIWLRRFLR